MRKILFFISLLLLPILLLSCRSETVKVSNILNGKVIKVADGDTITILNSQNKQIKIRL